MPSFGNMNDAEFAEIEKENTRAYIHGAFLWIEAGSKRSRGLLREPHLIQCRQSTKNRCHEAMKEQLDQRG